MRITSPVSGLVAAFVLVCWLLPAWGTPTASLGEIAPHVDWGGLRIIGSRITGGCSPVTIYASGSGATAVYVPPHMADPHEAVAGPVTDYPFTWDTLDVPESGGRHHTDGQVYDGPQDVYVLSTDGCGSSVESPARAPDGWHTRDVYVDNTAPTGGLGFGAWAWSTEQDGSIVVRGTTQLLVTAEDRERVVVAGQVVERCSGHLRSWEVGWAPFGDGSVPPDNGAWGAIAQGTTDVANAPMDWDTTQLDDGKYWLRLRVADCLDSDEIPGSVREYHTKRVLWKVWVENDTPRFALKMNQVNLDGTVSPAGTEVCNAVQPYLEVDLGHAITMGFALSGVGLRFREMDGLSPGGEPCPDQSDGPHGLEDLYLVDEVDPATHIHYLRYQLYTGEMLQLHWWNTCPHHNGRWDFSNGGQQVSWTWYNGSAGTQDPDPANVEVAFKNLVITKAEATGGLYLGGNGQFWVYDPDPERAGSMTAMNLHVELEKLVDQPTTVTIGIYSAEDPSAPLFTHVVETTSQSTFDWVWDGMIPSENPLLPGHPAEVGAYTFKVEANCSGDVDCDKSSHLTVSETDAEWANDYQEEAEYPCAFTVTYRLTDTPAGQGAEAAAVQVIDLSPTTALCGETAGTLLEGMNSVVVRTKEMGCLHSYLVCATDTHRDDDKAHRHRFALPHNKKRVQPQASCWNGHPFAGLDTDAATPARDYLALAGYAASAFNATGSEPYFATGCQPENILARLPKDRVMFIHCHGNAGWLATAGLVLARDVPGYDAERERARTLWSVRPAGVSYGGQLAGLDLHNAKLLVFFACKSYLDDGARPSMAKAAVELCHATAAVGFKGTLLGAFPLAKPAYNQWSEQLFGRLYGVEPKTGKRLGPCSVWDALCGATKWVKDRYRDRAELAGWGSFEVYPISRRGMKIVPPQ